MFGNDITASDRNLLYEEYVDEDARKQKPGFSVVAKDFANILKAFIGSNYLGLPFAFSNAGTVLGLIMLLMIAVITDHCCQLIVLCKKKAVKLLVERKDLENTSGAGAEDFNSLLEHIEKNTSYSDVGRVCFGHYGGMGVDIALGFTQFGFCVGYFIFMGVTLHDLIPQIGIEWLMLIPMPVLIATSFLRSVRRLAPFSILSNVAILVGFLMVCIYELSDYTPAPDVEEFKWSTFPVFFGTVTAAYEGIGTIIPIESSMGNNRRAFPKMLHTVIAIVSLILGSFGLLGYSKYGGRTTQIITQVLPEGTLMVSALQVGLVVGILFTYPLQLYPVIEITERLMFGEDQLNAADPQKAIRTRSSSSLLSSTSSQNSSYLSDESNDSRERRPLLYTSANAVSSDEGDSSVDLSDEDRRALFWKRNALRTALVLFSMTVGIVFRNDFVYFISIIGSLGSSALAFILPAVFHIHMFPGKLKKWEVWKNYAIIGFGVVGGVIGVVTVINDLVNK